jgi:CMP-N-acetylneuraminic acid synthetase
MKHVFFVPVKAVSERVPNKNFKPVPQFKNAPLYQIIPLKIAKVCNQLGLDYEIVMDSNSEEVRNWVRILRNTAPSSIDPNHPLGPGKYPSDRIISRERPEHLCNNSANGNYILREAVAWRTEGVDKKFYSPDSTIVWQAFVTTPLLSENTLRDMILRMEQHQWISTSFTSGLSILTVEPHQGFFWNEKGTPIGGYRPEVMLPSQNTPRIFKEIHGLFGIQLAEFLRLGCRTGSKPYFFPVPKDECLDIDWPSDLEKLTSGSVVTTPFTIVPGESASLMRWITPTRGRMSTISYAVANLTADVKRLENHLRSLAPHISWGQPYQPTPQTGDPNDPR